LILAKSGILSALLRRVALVVKSSPIVRYLYI